MHSELPSASSIAPSAAGFMGSTPPQMTRMAGMTGRRIPGNYLPCNVRIIQHITLTPISKAGICPVCHMKARCLSSLLFHGIVPLYLPAHACPAESRHPCCQDKLIPTNASSAPALILTHFPCIPVLIILSFCNPFLIPVPGICKKLTGTLGIVLVFHIRNPMI